ncbi:MAG: FAD-binding oxidoreductase [Myxococcota bacterium]
MSDPLPPAFLVALTEALGTGRVDLSEEALARAAHDETPHFRSPAPGAVITPRNTDEVALVLKEATRAGVYVTPRGAGTGKAGGCVPVQGGVVLSLEHFTEILEIDDENFIVRVQPGVLLTDLQQAVEARGLFYPPDPSSLAACTIGGNVATNAGGPRAVKYGVTGDYVLGLEVVLPTGEVVRTGRRTAKGVAGYDVTRLMVGSEGTLGVVTEVTLRLIARPAAVETALAHFPSSAAAIQCVTKVLRAGLPLRCAEYVDGRSLDALREHPGVTLRLPAASRAALLFEVDAPSSDEALAALGAALEQALDEGALETMVATGEKQRREVWQARRMLSEATRRWKPRKISEDVVVPRSRLPELVAQWERLGEEAGFITCAYGHAGDGNLHAQVLFDDESQLARVEELLKRLFELTLQLGGTISGEHGIGALKRPYLPLEHSNELLALQRRLKLAFDPAGILNPGKILPP